MIKGSMSLRLNIDGECVYAELGITGIDRKQLTEALSNMNLYHHFSTNDSTHIMDEVKWGTLDN